MRTWCELARQKKGDKHSKSPSRVSFERRTSAVASSCRRGHLLSHLGGAQIVVVPVGMLGAHVRPEIGQPVVVVRAVRAAVLSLLATLVLHVALHVVLALVNSQAFPALVAELALLCLRQWLHFEEEDRICKRKGFGMVSRCWGEAVIFNSALELFSWQTTFFFSFSFSFWLARGFGTGGELRQLVACKQQKRLSSTTVITIHWTCDYEKVNVCLVMLRLS